MIENLLHENCGIFAVYGAKKAAELTYLGLYALQHRGQEASGIVSSNGNRFYQLKGMGQVNDVFASKEVLGDLKGELAIGHNRYSTTGSSTIANITVTQVNVQASESTIREVDFAEESANFTKLQILAQAGTFAMSQANSSSQNVMSLLQ